jgi:hypothetical protein
MRIERAGRGAPGAAPRPLGERAAAAAGWSAPTPAAAPGGPVATARLAPLAGIEALVALQQVEGPPERRRRAARRGLTLLDGLAELQQGLLAGALPERTLLALRRGLGELESVPEDRALQAVLVEIAVRVEVELAKLEAPGAAASAPAARPPP